MKRHGFRFGTAVAASLINDPAQQEYRRKILELFNTVVIENALKWRQWDRNRDNGLRALAWLHANGIDRIRGHNIVWPGWRHMPSWVEGLKEDPDALRRAVREHVTDVASATRGQLIDWDVINEPYTNHDVQDILGEEEMAEWFRLARAADPDVTLYLNDYSIVNNGGYDLPHQDGYIRIAKLLDSLGAPLQGLGIQGHFHGQLTDPERVLQVFDRFAALNKKLLVTEFDVDTTDEQLQADYLRDFLTVAFSYPAIKGFYMWGFWAGRHWRPNSALYREDWTPKANAKIWNELVFHQWWTDVKGTTGADGIFRTRGFFGRYEIDVTRHGKVETFELDTSAGRSPAYLVAGKQEAGAFSAAGVVNAASFQGGAVAPGEIVTIFGAGFGSPALAEAAYADGWLPTSVGDTRVYFDGVAAPMIYSLTGQVSAIVPYSVTGETTVELEYLGRKTEPVTVAVANTAPGIFCYSAGRGQAVAVNDGVSFNGPGNPVAKGGRLTFFLTGEGPVTPAIGDGQLPSPPDFPAPAQPLGVYLGGRECPVEFTGLVWAGVTQVNIRVPPEAPAGPAVPLQVLAGGVASPENVTVAVG